MGRVLASGATLCALGAVLTFDLLCFWRWSLLDLNVTMFHSVFSGSYFARDAKYSNSYTGDADLKSMFVCRVLVGSYTKGHADYRRPPARNGGDVDFFDSCVDDITDPSIFVVFEKLQIYPEYLLCYRAGMNAYGSAPRPPPQPARPVAPPTTPTYRPAYSQQSFAPPPPPPPAPPPTPPPKKNDSCVVS